MKAVTIRGVDDEVSEKLKSTAVAQGKSVNQLTLEILKQGLGLKKEKNILENMMISMTCSEGGVKINFKKFSLK